MNLLTGRLILMLMLSSSVTGLASFAFYGTMFRFTIGVANRSVRTTIFILPSLNVHV